MEVIEMGNLRNGHVIINGGESIIDTRLPQVGIVISCTREEIQNMSENPLYKNVKLIIGKAKHKITINSRFSCYAADGQFVEVIWDAALIGERSDRRAKFRVIDSSHLNGNIPRFRGDTSTGGRRTFDIAELPNKEAVKSLVAVPC